MLQIGEEYKRQTHLAAEGLIELTVLTGARSGMTRKGSRVKMVEMRRNG